MVQTILGYCIVWWKYGKFFGAKPFPCTVQYLKKSRSLNGEFNCTMPDDHSAYNTNVRILEVIATVFKYNTNMPHLPRPSSFPYSCKKEVVLFYIIQWLAPYSYGWWMVFMLSPLQIWWWICFSTAPILIILYWCCSSISQPGHLLKAWSVSFIDSAM